jgi:hypothetical protein
LQSKYFLVIDFFWHLESEKNKSGNCNSAFESKLEAILNLNVIPTSDGRMPQSLKD